MDPTYEYWSATLFDPLKNIHSIQGSAWLDFDRDIGYSFGTLEYFLFSYDSKIYKTKQFLSAPLKASNAGIPSRLLFSLRVPSDLEFKIYGIK